MPSTGTPPISYAIVCRQPITPRLVSRSPVGAPSTLVDWTDHVYLHDLILRTLNDRSRPSGQLLRLATMSVAALAVLVWFMSI